MKTFTVTDADAEKLAELVRENAEYRPDYFGSLAAAILWQLNQENPVEPDAVVLDGGYVYLKMGRYVELGLPYKEECSQ